NWEKYGDHPERYQYEYGPDASNQRAAVTMIGCVETTFKMSQQSYNQWHTAVKSISMAATGMPRIPNGFLAEQKNMRRLELVALHHLAEIGNNVLLDSQVDTVVLRQLTALTKIGLNFCAGSDKNSYNRTFVTIELFDLPLLESIGAKM